MLSLNDDIVPVCTMNSNKLENFNYLNVAFISYKLTMWD